MNGFFLVMVVFLSVFAGTSWYIANRLYQGLVSVLPNISFWPVLVVVFSLALVLVLGFGRSMLPVSDGVKQVLGLISACGMGVFIYLLLFTVAVDVVMAVPRLLKLPFTARAHFRAAMSLCVVVLTGVTCIWGFFNAWQIDHVSYDVRLQDKKDISDLNIVLISDLHLGSVGSERRLGKVVEQINALEPDVLFIAGDFFDTDFAAIRDPEAAIKTLQDLRVTYGTYACLGNHDAGQTAGQMQEFLKQADIRLLNDAHTVIDDRLVLVGRLDASPIGGFGGETRKALSEFFVREDPGLPVIVLDHNPAHIREYGADADLILSGHTHKGQLYPASIVTNAMYDVDYGWYQKDAGSPQVIVTSGVGSWGMPMRVGTNCEIVTIRVLKG